MTETTHWHPVFLSRELGEKPAVVRLLEHDVVLFRTRHGVAALDDRCPHRAMPLHLGHVEDDRVVCPYHGWRWAADGRGESPGNPRAKPCAEAWACVEAMGAVWIRRPGADTSFPYVDVGGHAPVGVSRHRTHAPLELVLDNFIEVEHTPSVHALLGYRRDALHTVDVDVTVTDETVRVWNHGPQRPLPWALRRFFNVPDDPYFIDDWTVHFGPVRAVYDQYFLQGNRGPRRGDALRIAVFLTPRSARETELFVFAYSTASLWERPLFSAVQRAAVMALVDHEVTRDCALLAALDGAPLSLRNRALGRFDKALVASRKLLDRIYRGRREGALPVTREA